jgi:hypothetical protein
MVKHGAEFEKAVLEFVKALDPQAEVLFNHKVPDRDTGTSRQCDVWINAKFGGHWPLSILVSCKDHNTKLDINDIGTFLEEKRSTGAGYGVIYSKAGFTKPAIEKAKINGIACCRLYQKEPADIPGLIVFESFACLPNIQLRIINIKSSRNIQIWDDIFNLKDESGIFIDYIEKEFRKAEQQSVDKVAQSLSFPLDWQLTLRHISADEDEEISFQIVAIWKKYKAHVEATLLNGSYCISNNSFRGSFTGPWIDTQNTHPGDAWVEIDEPNFVLPKNTMLAILYSGDIKDALKKLGTQPIILLPK